MLVHVAAQWRGAAMLLGAPEVQLPAAGTSRGDQEALSSQAGVARWFAMVIDPDPGRAIAPTGQPVPGFVRPPTGGVRVRVHDTDYLALVLGGRILLR